MATEETKVSPRAAAQDMIRALKTERAGYAARGMTDRVADVDEQIAHWAGVARTASEETSTAGEAPASGEVTKAKAMIAALREEKAGLEGRDGKEKRVAAIDEQIKLWTGVLRKARSAGAAAAPVGAGPAGDPGQQQRA